MTTFKQKIQISIVAFCIITLAIINVTNISKAQISIDPVLAQLTKLGFKSYRSELSDQLLIDNGCKYLTSKLIPKLNMSDVYTFAQFTKELKIHKALLDASAITNSNILKQAQIDLTNAPTTMTSEGLTKYTTELRAKFGALSVPIEASIDSLATVLSKEGEIGKTFADNALSWYVDNQNTSLDFMINYFNTETEKLANNTIKTDYPKTEVQVMLDNLNSNFKTQVDNLLLRTQVAIDELDSGYGNIKTLKIEDGQCSFTFQDQEGKTAYLKVPLLKQFVCEKLNPIKPNITVSGNSCVEFK
jgi:hypothetical protein